jgi:hypothetical protein
MSSGTDDATFLNGPTADARYALERAVQAAGAKVSDLECSLRWWREEHARLQRDLETAESR